MDVNQFENRSWELPNIKNTLSTEIEKSYIENIHNLYINERNRRIEFEMNQAKPLNLSSFFIIRTLLDSLPYSTHVSFFICQTHQHPHFIIAIHVGILSFLYSMFS